jgi:hypothetical protein
MWNLATRYNGVINYFELWNEPQNAQFLYPYNGDELSTLATMTKRAYNTVHSINPNAVITSGSLLPRASSGGMDRAQQYLDAIQSAGWNVDAFSVHVNTAPHVSSSASDLSSVYCVIIIFFAFVRLCRFTPRTASGRTSGTPTCRTLKAPSTP